MPLGCKAVHCPVSPVLPGCTNDCCLPSEAVGSDESARGLGLVSVPPLGVEVLELWLVSVHQSGCNKVAQFKLPILARTSVQGR